MPRPACQPKPHHPTVVMVVMQATKSVEPKTAVELLTDRIRIMTSVTGMSRVEIHETIMSARNRPTEEEFRLAYAAAIILNGGSTKTDPITQRVQCTSCDDQGCGFCVPCEPHGQPTD